MALKNKATDYSRAKYECDICGKIDHWSDGWYWFGSIRQLENSDASTIATVCSEKCRKKHSANKEPILGS